MTTFKVVRFLASSPAHPPSPELLPEVLRSRWSAALAAAGGDRAAPGRPVRVALGWPLVVDGFPVPRFAAVDLQWFADARSALENGAWLASVDPELGIGSALLDGGSCQVVAEEVVLRGQDYLGARWAGGGERYKMMSFGRRNPRLTPEQFSLRWRREAGRLGGDAIPEEVRGLAYVQNHPVALDGHEWPFDAVNEVYFDRLDDLRRRRAWFTARQDAALRSPAMSFMSPAHTWSLFVREAPVTRPHRGPS
jgi:hypothetical protein